MTTQRLTRRLRGRVGSERGAAMVELLLLIPAVLVCVMLVAWAGRAPSAGAEIVRLTNNAASVASSSASASNATAAVDAMDVSSALCASVVLELNISDWNVGYVSVTGRCVVNTGGLEDLGVAGETIEHTSTMQVQQWGSRG